MTDLQFTPDTTDAFSETTPFEKVVDSSVAFSGGMWFSSGHWAMKTTEDGTGVLKQCHPYHTKGYWEKIPKDWSRFDTCAHTPALGRVSGFWCFYNTLCARVNDYGDDLIEGPGEIHQLWPLTHDTSYSTGLDAIACIGSKSADSATFRFFKGRSVRDYTRYSKGSGKSDEFSPEKNIFDQNAPLYPRLEKVLGDKPITSVMKTSEFTWFFFNEMVYKYHDTDETKDRGPGTVVNYIEAFDPTSCKCSEK